MSIGYKVAMRPNKIKAILVEKGVTVTSIAKRLGVSQPTVTLTIQGKTTSARIRAAIAEAIGQPVEKLWPEKKAA